MLFKGKFLKSIKKLIKIEIRIKSTFMLFMGTSSNETSDLLLTAGAAIRSFRIGKHLTQSQLAAKANLSLRALAKLERGEGSSLETFVRALQAVDASQIIVAMAPRPRISPLAMLKSNRVPQRVRQPRLAS